MARRRGQPTKLTPERQRIILETLRVGATFEAAAGRAGVALGTIHDWRARGRGDKKDRPVTKLYADFAAAVDEALADAEIRMVATIRKAGQQHWNAVAWILERRWPDRYGRREMQRLEVSGHLDRSPEDIHDILERARKRLEEEEAKGPQED